MSRNETSDRWMTQRKPTTGSLRWSHRARAAPSEIRLGNALAKRAALVRAAHFIRVSL